MRSLRPTPRIHIKKYFSSFSAKQELMVSELTRVAAWNSAITEFNELLKSGEQMELEKVTKCDKLLLTLLMQE